MPATKATDRLIDAISSLKRVVHIENLRDMPDHVINDHCSVYTSSQETTDMFKDILAQALASHHTASYWQEHPGQGLHEKIQPDSSREWGIFGLSFPVSENSCQMLAERIEAYTQKLIAPDEIKRSR